MAINIQTEGVNVILLTVNIKEIYSSNHKHKIIIGTRKYAPCLERVFISFKLQEAIEAVKPTYLCKKVHSRINTE